MLCIHSEGDPEFEVTFEGFIVFINDYKTTENE